MTLGGVWGFREYLGKGEKGWSALLSLSCRRNSRVCACHDAMYAGLLMTESGSTELFILVSRDGGELEE